MTDGVVRVTNIAQIRIEEDVGRRTREAAFDRSAALSTAAVRAAIDASGLGGLVEPEHWEAQKAAIYAMGEGGALTLLTGVAGAGKTTILQPLVRAWKADTRLDAGGREVVGLAIAWKQADALQDAGIERGFAMSTMLDAIAKAEFKPTGSMVLVIDEISQVGPRAMLKLLELPASTGMTIKALGDREQAQSIEASDTIELMRRVVPKAALPELLSTVRQDRERDRTIANLFRQGKAAEALAMKREDGTAMLVGGDQDQVIGRIADLYIQRRDHLQAAGTKRGATISTLTNDDAADISRVVRARLQERGEISRQEKLYDAIDQRRQTYTLPIAKGDSLRLFRKTWAMIGGKGGWMGSNGDIVTVVARTETGLTLRNKRGKVGEVERRRLSDPKSGRLLLGFGHALTIDAAQGMTSREHIDALPRGTAGITSFKGYVAESRATGRTWTMVSEAAVHEAERRSRALGDGAPVTVEDLWARTAKDMSTTPYKAMAIDLAKAARHDREKAIAVFIGTSHKLETMKLVGRDVGGEVRKRLEADAVRKHMERHIPALDEALTRNADELGVTASDINAHLSGVRTAAEAARLRLEAAASARSSSPGPG